MPILHTVHVAGTREDLMRAVAAACGAIGSVTVGTNRKGAAAHHKGIPGRLPQRRLWPEPQKWPAEWWQGIEEQARDQLIDVAVAAISGQNTADAIRGLQIAVGLELLDRISEAFVVKSDGGTDAAGERWAPLSPKTIAYGRKHPGLPPPDQRAAKRPSYALREKQRKKWWRDYSAALARYKGNKAHAAAVAWLQAKEAGATTLLEKYGGTKVQILRDSGILLNSLSPGAEAGTTVATVPPVVDQIFEVEQ